MSDPVARLNAALEGRYAIDRELGEGGMGAVWKGKDLLFAPIADGQWHEYVVDCTQSSAWTQWTPQGRIGIALPVPASGELKVELMTIHLLP